MILRFDKKNRQNVTDMNVVVSTVNYVGEGWMTLNVRSQSTKEEIKRTFEYDELRVTTS